MGKLYEKSLSFYNNWNEPNNNEYSNKKKISVVIPVYHPRYLKEVLNHLSKLNLIDEVITVFDSLDDNPDEIINDYTFNLIIVQHDKNRNAPAANNTGAVHAAGDIIIFLDQDMILSPQFIPNALKMLESNDYKGLVVGFRDTVEFKNVPELESWKESNYYNDWRIKTSMNDNFLDLTVSNCGSSINNCTSNDTLEIYKKSNKFKNLGIKKESTLGFWDLPCMVISHTLAIPKKEFIEIGGFPEWIIGWGGEDIALGFLAVAKHLFIMPIEVGSYHIKHDPHSGSEEKKWNEMRENLIKYKKWSSTVDDFVPISIEKIMKRSRILYKSVDKKQIKQEKNENIENDLILKYIIDSYNLKCDSSLVKIHKLIQYPHIVKLIFPNHNLFLKKVQKSRTHCFSINQLYYDLSGIKCVEKPMITKNGEFSLTIGNQIILLYEELQELNHSPGPIWWSNCLGDIHNIIPNKNYKCHYSNKFYYETLSVLTKAEKYISKDRKNKIYKLLKSVDMNTINEEQDIVLCHNDPYDLNVMLLKEEHKLIDTEGMGLSPREYDIQRLMHNYAINNTNSLDNIIRFWEIYKENYEEKTTKKINIKLLQNIYVMDLIKSISWLYMVCNDTSRNDRQRQYEQLLLFEKSLDNDIHSKVLEIINI